MTKEVAVIWWWWWMCKHERYHTYIRLAHMEDARNRSSFWIFWRYFNSSDPKDLKRFVRVTRDEFDELYSKV